MYTYIYTYVNMCYLYISYMFIGLDLPSTHEGAHVFRRGQRGQVVQRRPRA